MIDLNGRMAGTIAIGAAGGWLLYQLYKGFVKPAITKILYPLAQAAGN